MLNGLDLFSGIGGLTIALAPWVRPIAYCESDKYCQAVLLSQMQRGGLPYAGVWDDVRTLNAEELSSLPDIEIIYGGFPCQDISVAGNGKGLEGERSGLYAEILRLTNETNCRFIFLENVPAIRTRGAERIGKELATRGYDCRWMVVSAAEVGAPHKRERWFLLAHANGSRLQKSGNNEITEKKMVGIMADSDSGFDDSKKRSVFTGRVSSQFCFQESFWKKTNSELLRMDDGIPPGTHRIKALGNAVVPIQAREAFKRLMGITCTK